MAVVEWADDLDPDAVCAAVAVRHTALLETEACEGVGPLTRQQVIDFLGHTNVRVVPVLDLAAQTPVDGYEVPTRMAEALQSAAPRVFFPRGAALLLGAVRPFL